MRNHCIGVELTARILNRGKNTLYLQVIKVLFNNNQIIYKSKYAAFLTNAFYVAQPFRLQSGRLPHWSITQRRLDLEERALQPFSKPLAFCLKSAVTQSFP